MLHVIVVNWERVSGAAVICKGLDVVRVLVVDHIDLPQLGWILDFYTTKR